MIFRVNKIVSAGAAIRFQGIATFFMESSTVIARAQQQQNATAAQFDSLEFFVRRLEEYERTLSVLTTRIEESYMQEITLFGLYLNCLLGRSWTSNDVTSRELQKNRRGIWTGLRRRLLSLL